MKLIQTKEEFNGLIATGVVLADFFAEWCGPCKMLSPILEEVSKEVTDVTICKVNVDDLPEIAAEAAIRAMPTLVLFKDGKEVDRVIGFKGKTDLINWINSKK